MSFRTADGCVEENTTVASASDQTELDTSLAWSEVPIGAVVEVQCMCGISLPRTATRLCAGGFASISWFGKGISGEDNLKSGLNGGPD